MRSDRGYAWAHYTSLAVALIVLLFASRGLWFFYDEWAFISSRGLHHPALGLFAPHNEHWSTLPILLYRVLLTILGMHTYLPYLLVLFLVHLVLVHLLWRAMRTLPVHPMIAVGLAAVFALLGSGAQNLLWAFQVGFVASLCLGWAFVLWCVSARWSRSVVLASWAWGIAALMCSGLGVTMVVMGGLAALLARGWRHAGVLVSVPLVAFAIWYVAVGHTTPPASSRSIHRVPGYIGTGIGNALTHLIGLNRVGTWVGVVIGLGALAAVTTRVLRSRPRDAARPGVWTRLRAYPVVAASVAGVLVLWTITAAGRAGLGNQQALSSRYVYNTVAVGLPALALALDTALAALLGRVRLSRRRFTMAVVALALTGVLLAANVWQLRQARRVQLRVDQLSRAQILTAAYLMRHGTPYLPGGKAAGIYAPTLDAADLDRIIRQGWLTIPTAVSVSVELTVRADMQDLLDPRPPVHAVALRLRDVRVTIGSASDPVRGCLDIVPASGRIGLALGPFTHASSLGLQTVGTQRFRIKLVDPANPDHAGTSSPFILKSGRPHRLVSIATGVNVELLFDARHGPLRICG